MTQKQLADALGIHRNTIGRWEEGSYLPESKALVLELARSLHLDEPEARQLLEASLVSPSPIWHVPYSRNLFFTGRTEVLEQLHKHLGPSQQMDRLRSYALSGLGGVGKTQLALEYAYQHVLEYRAIFWIAAETLEQQQASLLSIAERLELPEYREADHKRVVAAVQRWLETHEDWLLVWDNLENLDPLPDWLSLGKRGTMLITTRCQALGSLTHGLNLAPLSQEEGVLLLLRRARILEPVATRAQVHQFATHHPDEDAAATRLVEMMGGLPLALDQVGAYIEETRCSLCDYLSRYQQKRKALLDRRGLSGNHHPRSVTATFLLARERVGAEQPAAASLLWACTFLHAEAIPEELFYAGAPHLGPELASLATDEVLFDEVIALLQKYSLMQRHSRTHTFSLHRLIQTVLREQMNWEEQGLWLQRAVAALNALFPEVTFEAWEQCERLLPHVLTCAETLRNRPEHPEILADVLRKAADYALSRAHYPLAERLYRQALDILEQGSAPDKALQVARVVNQLASLSLDQSKFEEAEPLYRRALQLKEQSLGLEDLEITSTLNGLGLLYSNQGKYEQAQAIYQRSLQIREHHLGPDHPLVGQTLLNLGILLNELGRYRQAEFCFQRSLHISERHLSHDHPDLAYALGWLARIFYEMGQYEQSELFFQRAVRLREKHLGPDHPRVMYSLIGLAALYQELGRDEEAERLYQRSLQVLEHHFGSGHSMTLYALHGLASLYTSQGKDAEAKHLFLQALRISKHSLGPDHPNLAFPLNGLANIYFHQEKPIEAEELFQQALRLRAACLGEGHPATAQTLVDLAHVRQQQGRWQEALAFAGRALRTRVEALGENHPKTVQIQAFYAQLLQQAALSKP